MWDFVSDKRFVVGVAVGAFIVPWAMRTVSLKMANRPAKAA